MAMTRLSLDGVDMTLTCIAPMHNTKGRSGTPSELQGWLLSILAHYPTTADSAQSCLLCYQPEPVPRTLAARTSQFTLGYPCRLSAWPGWAIHMHPQHMQHSSVLYLPHITVMTGQVKVSCFLAVLRHSKMWKCKVQIISIFICWARMPDCYLVVVMAMEDCRMCMGYFKVKIVRNRSSTFLLPPLGRVHSNANQQRAMTMTKLSLDTWHIIV